MDRPLPLPPIGQPLGARIGRRAAALLMLGAALGATAPGAAALRHWCRTDPVVTIRGDVADVFVSGPLDAPVLVTGPNRIVIRVPTGVDATLIASTLGFGKGEEVSFEHVRSLKATDRGTEVVVKVYVPAVNAMPVLVEFAPRIVGILAPASVEGTANTWVTLRTVL